MKLLITLALMFALLVSAALANTEKVIFVAPKAIGLPNAQPGLDTLDLETLTSDNLVLGTSLEVAFPTKDRPQGVDHWFLLRDLNEHQRYELRVCWAAVQPTTFWLDVYDISHVFDTPELVQSLADYSELPSRRRPGADHFNKAGPELFESVLFLHLRSAADYFTTNKTLMLQPPQVEVDLILDPFLWNVFPQSLGPTAIYIIITAVVAWLVSGFCWKYLAGSQAKAHQD